MHSMHTLSRRDFLKLAGTASLGLALPTYPIGGSPSPISLDANRLGRAAYSLRYYKKPTTKSEELGFYITDDVFQILGEAVGEQEPNGSFVWLRTPEGWVNSSFVQPVRKAYNEPETEFPKLGFLAEVTVPLTQAWRLSEGEKKRAYRFYYGSTHWVIGSQTDRTGNVWYVIPDDLFTTQQYLVEARHLHRITAEEVAPISPDVTSKRIEVNLADQKLTALENGIPVFNTRIASGYVEGDTPVGAFHVERKQPSRHMGVDSLEGGGFDLPGVPWVCFILWTGVSFHGTYWHNNYGHPQSHGCINLSPAAAKWIYRWTTPVVPVEDNYEETKSGTEVVIY